MLALLDLEFFNLYQALGSARVQGDQMNVRKLIIGAATLAAVLCVPVASAIPLTWKLVGVTFDDGSTADGSFIMDNGTGVLSNWNITTHVGTLDFAGLAVPTLGFIYNPGTSTPGDTCLMKELNWLGPVAEIVARVEKSTAPVGMSAPARIARANGT